MSLRMKVNGWSGSTLGASAADADTKLNIRPFTSPVKFVVVNDHASHTTADGCVTGVLLIACSLHSVSVNVPLTNVLT